MENQPTTGNVILHFCVDGVRYALRQNQLTQEQAYERLKEWLPDADIEPAILHNPQERLFDEDGS